jgi:hypothetical protein
MQGLQIAAGRWAKNACQCHTALELNCRPVPTLIRRALLAHHVGIRQSVVQNHEPTVDAAMIFRLTLAVNHRIVVQPFRINLFLRHRQRARHDDGKAEAVRKPYRAKIRPLELRTPNAPSLALPSIAAQPRARSRKFIAKRPMKNTYR